MLPERPRVYSGSDVTEAAVHWVTKRFMKSPQAGFIPKKDIMQRSDLDRLSPKKDLRG